MTCSRVKEQAPLFVGGELLGQERVDFERHLAECEECQSLVTETEASLDWLKEDAQAPFSLEDRQQFRQALMARVREEAAPRKHQQPVNWKLGAAWMGLAAAALFVIVAGRNQGGTTNTGFPEVAANGTADAPKGENAEPLKTALMPPAKTPTLQASTKPRQAPKPVQQSGAPLEMAVATQAPARIEFQTDNPNIRIIWLAGCQGVGQGVAQGVAQGAEPEPLPDIEIPWPSVEEPPVPPIS